MLDPFDPQPVDLTDFSTYIGTCLDIAQKRLAKLKNTAAVAEKENELNKYPRLASLEEPKNIHILDEELVGQKELARACKALLDGSVLLEHTCAGEATRLGMGTKYLINPRLDLSPKTLTNLLGENYDIPVDPDSLRSMNLGRRHMLQLAWDLSHLAEEAGKDPAKVLQKQTLLVIVNQASWEAILHDFSEANFYGFSRPRVLFMVQHDFHGITREGKKWIYDTNSPRRLHNHGQMLLQTAMDNQIFRLSDSGRPAYLTWSEYRQILGEFEDKVSFNIEDLDYLSQSLDIEGLAAALKLSDGGARMVMEVVANNPDNPQKGGLCAWDSQLKRDVMVESFQLAGMDNSQITYLNKNVNHYPFPSIALTQAREYGLSMPIAVKKGFLYFQPIQGDVNFLVDTAFMQRKTVKPINSWKSGANTFQALEAMAEQEKRKGFVPWAKKLTGLGL
jgi:hypothetical protein